MPNEKEYAMTADITAADSSAPANTSDASALPAFFEPLLREQYDERDVSRIMEGCAARRATTLRANTLRATREEVTAALDQAGITWSPVSWYADAFVIEGASGASDQALWDLPIYQEGKIYLQSLSSMLPPLALGAQAGIDILDMCAAPGGKTTQLAALGGSGCHITACEMHAPRAEKLEYNLRKLGASNVVVMRTDARRLDEFFRFDRILLDAPCSGSGTLHVGDPKLHARFTPKLIQKSRKAQSALLDKALCLLKPGGTLVYSTCSVLACENEEIVRGALDRVAKAKRRTEVFKVEPVTLPGTPDLACLPTLPTTLEGALCICPTERYEGFFMAKIRRVK